MSSSESQKSGKEKTIKEISRLYRFISYIRRNKGLSPLTIDEVLKSACTTKIFLLKYTDLIEVNIAEKVIRDIRNFADKIYQKHHEFNIDAWKDLEENLKQILSAKNLIETQTPIPTDGECLIERERLTCLHKELAKFKKYLRDWLKSEPSKNMPKKDLIKQITGIEYLLNFSSESTESHHFQVINFSMVWNIRNSTKRINKTSKKSLMK